ncbi:hypothetical protein ACFQ4L_03810 [Lapidilactobacillus mulanensis]|uniref:Uncharacterized protein n=1 Tax=Lapidilactobacillus mulanensis TaxID=2485999 RepID=A0ABW4DNX0_9LACO|nr:hypothetical protein [Lapidilactobacillus mulanensis]
MWWQILLVIVAAVVVYFVGHHLWLRQRQISYQKYLDQQVELIMPALVRVIPHLLPDSLKSAIPVSIWHRDVLIYEYSVQLSDNTPIVATAAQLSVILNEAPGLKARLVVTECWQRDTCFHFDVAYLNNPETVEYVGDMEKIAEVDEKQSEIHNS